MTELSPEAEALFRAARARHEPSAKDRAAVRRAVALELGAAAGGATLLTPTAGSAAGALGASSGALTWTALGKLLVTGFAVGSATVGAAAVGKRLLATEPAERATVRGAPAPREEAAEPHERAPAPRAPTPDVEPGLPAAPAPSRLRAPIPGAPVAPGASALATAAAMSSAAFAAPEEESPRAAPARSGAPMTAAERLRAEALALAEAQHALDQGRPGDALGLLAEQERAFARGALGEERRAARVFALCALGRAEQAREEARRFLVAAPSSPLGPRVRAACRAR